MKLIECVPNISEGRDQAVIDAVVAAAAAVEGVEVLDVDPGADTNRTVITFVGAPEAVVEGAFQLIAKATELIDMRHHHGAHARHGAVDVCPFVPVRGATMQDCIDAANQLGARVGEELDLPVYLYENAAKKPERRNLAVVRQGEYEALSKKLGTDEWRPDFGPNRFDKQVAKTGVVTIGAREFLIAYNINLNNRDKRFAIDIAFEIREKGRTVRTGNIEPHYFRGEILRYQPAKGRMPCGLCDQVEDSVESLEKHYREVHDFDWRAFLKTWNQPIDGLAGRPVKTPGIFKFCKATGWVIEDYNCAQITMNLTNPKATPIHEVYERCVRLAEERGVRVTGSEVVGLIPFDALYEAGRYYLRRFNGPQGLPWRDVLEVAVRSMGMDDVAPFEIDKKVIGLPEEPKACLMALSARDFVAEVSRESPAPGGGSVSALAGALGAGLSSMVANLTVGKEGYDAHWEALDEVGLKAQSIIERLVRGVDTDTEAFNEVMAAMRLPKGSKEERERRQAAIQAGYKSAAQVPLETAKLCAEAAELALEVIRKGNRPSITDGGVAALVAAAGVEGAVYNVRINLPAIKDEAFKAELSRELDALVQRARKARDQADALVVASFEA